MDMTHLLMNLITSVLLPASHGENLAEDSC